MEAGLVCKVKPIKNFEAVSNRLEQKHPGFELLTKINQRLDTLKQPTNLQSEPTPAIAVSLQGPNLPEKDPAFQAWKKASYNFLCQEFGKENLVYLHLAQDKPIPAIHCIFVPIESNQLAPRAFVGTSVQKGYLDRYQALLDRLIEQTRQANQLTTKPTEQRPIFLTHNQHHTVSRPTTSPRSFRETGILDRAKREIDLVQFAIDELGYLINKRKSCRKYVVLDHGKGTPKIMVYQYEGRWRYKPLPFNSQEKGKTIVDLLLESGKGYKIPDITELLRSKLDSPHAPTQERNQYSYSSEPPQDPAQQRKLAQYKLARFASIGVETYLEKRGIERITYQGIEGLKTNSQGAIFGLYTKVDTQGQGKLCSTITYYPGDEGEGSKKYFQKGLPRGLSVLKPSGEIKELFITESPIDALSHKQIYGTEHTLYLSTCGSIERKIARNLEAVFIQAKEQSIVVKLGFDQDGPGREMAQQVAAISSKQGITCQMEFPSIGKDWNDMLLASKQQTAQLDQPKLATGFGRSL